MALTFRAKLLASYLGLVLVAEGIAFVVLDRSLGADLVEQLDARLEQQATGAAAWVVARREQHGELLAEGSSDRQATRLAAVVRAWVTIFDARGVLIGDSERRDPAPAAEGEAPELLAARREGVGRATRWSTARGEALHYVAVRADEALVVRLAVPLSETTAPIRAMRARLAAASALAFLAALALGLLAARAIAAPLRAMTRAAAELARGNYRVEVLHAAPDELGTLAASLASLAAQLEARIGELTTERDRLRRLETIRRDFVANVSHELRTPVAAIQGYAETLLQGADAVDAKTRGEFLEVVHRHARRLGRLVEDLLRLSEIEARGPREGPCERVAVAEVYAHVAGTARDRLEAKGTRLTIAAAPGLVVRADRDGLEQVLDNLVDNAIKYGVSDGRVSLEASAVGAQVELVVADDGPGIAAAHLPRIFERFYRVDPGRTRALGGAGLGLAIVKHLVEAMGGTVAAESDGQRGARFVVRLPAG